MQTFTHFSAYGRIEIRSSGLAVVTYGGPMRAAVFADLREKVLESLDGAHAILADVRAMLPCACRDEEFFSKTRLSQTAPPGAIVVNDAQIELWSNYAIHASLQGVTRAIFTDYAKASVWAAGQAALWAGRSTSVSKIRSPSGA